MNINNEVRSALDNYQAGNYQQAINICRKILETDPSNIAAINLLGIICYQHKDYDSAIQYMKKLITLNSDNAQAYYIIGHSMQEKNQLDEAVDYYRKALQINPDFADVYYNLGTIFEDRNRKDEALSCYQRALQINPADIDACYNAGRVLQEQKQFDEAIARYQKALQINPDLADAHNNIGIILQEKGQLDEAMSHSQRALELNPDLADAHNNIGIILQEKGQLDEAMSHSQRALELNPDFYKAYYNLGRILQEKGQLDEAVSCYQKALELNPNDADVHCALGFAFLALGNFRQGWKEYEWRWISKVFFSKRYSQPSDFSQPLWDGSSLEGKTIFVLAEQGVGDQIMFASCLQDIIEHAELCTVECEERLIPIFRRSFPNAVFVGCLKEAASSPHLASDFVIPVGSLPTFLRSDSSSFPQKKSYLVPDEEKVNFWRNRLRMLSDGLKVGISWRGGSLPKDIRNRSIQLEKWDKLLPLSGVHFINLQYGDCSKELMDVKEKLGVTIHDWEDSDPLKDLDSFAAQISALDLVISVDNSAVHLAGALGAPVWTLLPFAADWRWMRDFEDTPWYPTVRLFRQSTPDDWDEVFECVHEILKEAVDKGTACSEIGRRH